MKLLSRYIIAQILGPVMFFTLVLAGVVWLSQALRMLDLLMRKGQTVLVYLEMTSLMLPLVFTIVLPIALFASVLYALHRLYTESELVVMFSAGLSQLKVARPILALATLFAGIVLLLNLLVTPYTLRLLRERVMDIRADIAVTLLREGAFTTPSTGLTVYVREQRPGGDLYGIMAHDNRERSKPVTYIAESGTLTKSDSGPRLVMVNGNIQRSNRDDGRLSLVYFDKYTFDLAQFAEKPGTIVYDPAERYINELFNPDLAYYWDRINADKLRAEGHRRFAAPLYCFAYVLLALLAMVNSSFNRQGYGLRVSGAIAAGITVELVSLGVVNLVAETPQALLLIYFVPTILIALTLLFLWNPRNLRLARERVMNWLATGRRAEPAGTVRG